MSAILDEITGTSTVDAASVALPAWQGVPILPDPVVGPDGVITIDGIAVVGANVWGSMARTEIAVAEATRLLTEAGFGKYAPTRGSTAKGALKRAIREWSDERAGVFDGGRVDAPDTTDVGRTRELIRTIQATPSKNAASDVVYALVEEGSLVRALGLRYATAYRFLYKANDGQLFISSAASGPIAAQELATVEAEIRPIWDKHRDLLLSGDIGRIVTQIIQVECKGMSLREAGGLYFCPATFIPALQRLAVAVAQFPTVGRRGASLSVVAQPDFAGSRDIFRRDAWEALQGEIDAAERGLGRFQAQNTRKRGSVREGTVDSLLAEYMDLRDRARVYADTIGVRDARVEESIASLETQARALLVDRKDVRGSRATQPARRARKATTGAAVALAPSQADDDDLITAAMDLGSDARQARA